MKNMPSLLCKFFTGLVLLGCAVAVQAQALSPNAIAIENAFDQWTDENQAGRNIFWDPFDPEMVRLKNAILDDINSVSPEAAVSMGVFLLQAHNRIANMAVQQGLGTGAPELAAVGAAGERKGGVVREPSAIVDRFWVGYLGDFSRIYSKDGFSGLSTDSHGLLLGVTRTIEGTWSVGGYLGYAFSKTEFKSLSAKNEANLFNLGAYGRYEDECGLKATLDGAFTYADNDLRRSPGGAPESKGDFGQFAASIALELAWELPVAENVYLTPFGSARHTWLRQQSFTEKGGPLITSVDSFSATNVNAMLGARLSWDVAWDSYTLVTPSLSLAYQHTFGDQSLLTTGRFAGEWLTPPPFTPQTFEVESIAQKRKAIVGGVAVEVQHRTSDAYRINGKFGYNVEVREGMIGHSVFVGAGWVF